MHRIRLALLALPVVFAAGCGGGTGAPPAGPPVGGKVEFKDGRGDVRWLAGGKVRLHSLADPNLVAVGVIGEDGSFSVGTHTAIDSREGVPPGEYAASVVPARDATLLPKYLDPKTSGLRASVPAAGPLLLTVEGGRRR